VVRQLATKVFIDVQEGADKHTKTGALFQSVRMQRIDSNEYIVFHALQRAPYAPFVHWGAKPHIIKPKKKRALRWAKGGRFFFAKVVHHPGYKGDPYMVRALDNAPNHFETIVQSMQGDL
jgi:hypothetical protein